MAIFNLPDEPDSPAGKAIQTAQAPSAEQMASKVMPNKFQLVFKSDPYLGDSVHGLLLDLGRKELIFNTIENGQYNWIDWLLEVPEDEVVTLFFLDENNKHRCILVMEGLYVFEHTCSMNNSQNAYGIDSPENLEHKVTIQFTNIERLHPEGHKGKSVKRVARKPKDDTENS